MNIIQSSFNINIEKSICDHWRMAALTDYDQKTMLYADVAEEIAKLHLIFRESGIRKGDRIALAGSNQSRWAVVMLSCLTYGAVAVPVLHDFSSEQMEHIVNHSEAKLLFVSERIASMIDSERMKDLSAIIQISDYSVLVSRERKIEDAAKNINLLFGQEYPGSFTQKDVHYHKDKDEELAIINYTSGTTSNPKGVMIPFRALTGNATCADDLFGEHAHAGDTILSLLPMAHTLSMSFEFLYEFIIGVHIHFLTRKPTPTVLLKAMADIKPIALVCVPLIIEKVVRKAVMKRFEDPKVRLLLKTPFVGRRLKNRICQGIREGFGGNFYEVVIGGAALNQEVEALLHDIGFNYTVGYGATECAPLISCEDWKKYVPGSCGKSVRDMTVKIDSRQPYAIPGEILVKGRNLMLGYYKNHEATAETLKDSWYHTGDLGVLDKYGNIFVKGRIKNMLLSANGQNIYPEEIEDKLANMPLVQECIVIQRDSKLYGLVYPNQADIKAQGLTQEAISAQMEENRKALNAVLPQYEQITAIGLRNEEFEKTPKRSIKRFLYA